MPKVTIIYRTIPQYRIEFYNLLKEGLLKRGIELELIYGDNPFKGRNDNVHSDWATYKKNFSLNFYKFYIIWQPCIREVQDSDLVIVEQANKLLFNYYLIIRKIFKHKKFAFWGHGLNRQIKRTSIFNRFKLTYINRANWWFAYTEGIKSFLIDRGVDKDRITVVQNAIDTKQLNVQYNSIPEAEVDALRKKYDLQQDEKVLIYCGALSKEKNIPFLVETADRLRAAGHKFRLVIMGNGPMVKFVEMAAQDRPWLIYTGPKFGREKALYFRLSDIFLLPGAMGLAILDSFAFETPIVTMKSDFHGPEFEYIEDGNNAIVTEGNLEDYTEKVAALMKDPQKINMMKVAAKLMILKYNIEAMVENFIEGIEKALV